jgi:hypothetical protein
MPTAGSALIPRVRRFVGDYPEYDTLGASCTSSATTLATTVNPASGSYAPGFAIQVDQEALLVKTASSVAASMTVMRAHMGTTGATHASGAPVLIKPAFLDVEILDAINYALGNTFPHLYKPVAQEYTGIASSTYEYELPNMTGIDVPIPYVYRVEYKENGDSAFRQVNAWSVRRGVTPILQFRRPLPGGGTIRILGFGPFEPLAIGDSTDASFPVDCADLLVTGAGEYLLSSGEARRVRVDVGMIDNREQATRVGSSMNASNALLSRFERQLSRKAMPPMPRHVKATF